MPTVNNEDFGYMTREYRGPPLLFADGSHLTMSRIKDLEKKNYCGSVILFLGTEQEALDCEKAAHEYVRDRHDFAGCMNEKVGAGERFGKRTGVYAVCLTFFRKKLLSKQILGLNDDRSGILHTQIEKIFTTGEFYTKFVVKPKSDSYRKYLVYQGERKVWRMAQREAEEAAMKKKSANKKRSFVDITNKA
jgi:hypothetical protein